LRGCGLDFQAGLAELWQVVSMTISLPFKIRRFVIIAICATLVVSGMFFVEFFVFPDIAPPTPFENAWFCVWAVASWPLSVVWFMSQRDPSLMALILLTTASGLFWAFIVELFFKLKGQRKRIISN
jgi:hypothetical protein